MEPQENSDSSSATSGCSGVTDIPAVSRNVQWTPDILAELRARAMRMKLKATQMADESFAGCFGYMGANENGKVVAYNMMLEWLDELAPPRDNTAPDTTSGSAGDR